MPGKYLNPVRQARTLHRQPKPSGEVVNIDSALAGQQRRRQQDPEVASSLAHFECRFDDILPEVVLELQQIFHCVLIVGINRYPFAALRRRIDLIQANCYLALQVPPDGLLAQSQRCLRILLRGPEIIVTPALRVRAHGLHCVAPPVNKQAEIVVTIRGDAFNVSATKQNPFSLGGYSREQPLAARFSIDVGVG